MSEFRQKVDAVSKSLKERSKAAGNSTYKREGKENTHLHTLNNLPHQCLFHVFGYFLDILTRAWTLLVVLLALLNGTMRACQF